MKLAIIFILVFSLSRQVIFLIVNCLMGPVHFYNCKFKEKTSNNYSASDNMGSGPLALVITIPTVPTGINRFLDWQPDSSPLQRC